MVKKKKKQKLLASKNIIYKQILDRKTTAPEQCRNDFTSSSKYPPHFKKKYFTCKYIKLLFYLY